MNNKLKKPNFIHLFFGLLITKLEINIKYENLTTPQRIGKYTLLSEFKKDFGSKNYSLGIYIIGHKKVFIKTWNGTIKDLSYFTLLTEYFSNKVLYRKLNSLKSSETIYKLKVPKVIDHVQSKESFSIVFEFIEGKPLDKFPLNKQVDVFFVVLKYLYKISDSLTTSESNNFLKINSAFYFITFPFFIFLTLFSIQDNYKEIIRMIIDSFKAVKQFKTKKLFLAHRDLEPHNVIIKDLNIYIIDCERMAFTVPYYDINHLSLKPDFKPLSAALFGKMKVKPNIFLKNYIIIQFASVPDRPNFKNFYLQQLKTRYT